MSLSNDARSLKDFAKVHRAPAVMLKKLPEKLQKQWQDVRQLQVLGIVGSADGFCTSFESLLVACLIIFFAGRNMTILRIMCITTNAMTNPTSSLLREWEGINKVFAIN